MFLLGGDSEASGTGVTVEVEGPVFVRDRVPVGEDDDRPGCEFREKGDRRCSSLRR